MLRKSLLVLLTLQILFVSSIVADETVKSISLLKKSKYIPDIGTFLQIGANIPNGISADGRQLFFTSSASGSPQVYRILDDGWPYQLTTFDDGIDFFTLSNDASMGIIGASIGGSEQSQLYLIDTETGRVLPLTNFEDIKMGSVVWAKNDLSIFYRSNEENKKDFFLYKMDITTGETNKIFNDPGYNSIASISGDGNFLFINKSISSAKVDLYMLNLSTGEHVKINSNADSDALYFSPTLMPDNKTIWLVCNDNPDGVNQMAKMTVGSPEVEFINDGWIDAKWEIEKISFSRDYKIMAVQFNEEGYTRLKLRDIETGKELPPPPLDGMLAFNDSDENGNLLLSFAGPTRAPDCWLWNPTTKKLTQRTHSIYAGIDRKMFREPKLIKYKSFDGLEIPAFLYLPPDFKGESIPFIVLAHGGPASQFQPRFIRNIQHMMLNGYGVLCPNPRGSAGYGQHYKNLDNYKFRKNSLKDYKAGVEWLLEHEYTKKGMIGIRGGSYGGYVVLGMITEYPDLFSAAVDNIGIANFKSFLENTKAYRRAHRENEYGPLSDPEFLKSISPIHKAHLIKTPLLVMHGENDPRVPVSEARQIIKSVNDNGGIVDSLIFPDEGHGAKKRVNIIAQYRKQVEFFNRHLKPMVVDKKE